jgi:hypothetical protein
MDDGGFQVAISTLLQRQSDKLDTLIERITVLERFQGRPAQPWPSKAETVASLPEQPLPLFQRSPSALFYISVVDTNLKALENSVTGPSPEENNPSPPRTSFSIVEGQIVNEMSSDAAEEEFEDVPLSYLPGLARNDSQTASIQPLNCLGCEDVIRLVHEYQDLAGMMYPMLDIAYMVQRAQELWTRSTVKGLDNGSLIRIDRKEVAILKLMVAIALITEDESFCELALKLYESLWPEVEAMIWNTKVDLKGLILLTLVVCLSRHPTDRG